MKKKFSSDTKAACSLTLPEATSPNSKTNFEMRKQGLSPSKNPLVKRKLLFENLVSDHATKKATMTDKIVKKYKCTAEAGRTMGVKWKQFLGVVEEKKREKKKETNDN